VLDGGRRVEPAFGSAPSCPCDGSLDADVYSAVVGQLITAIDGSPNLLLERLEERMERLAHQQRYEEAAWVRDRHDSLAKALRNNWEWRSLVGAGWMELEHDDGTIAVIDHGRLVETRGPGQLSRLHNGLADPVAMSPVAPGVESAEEAAIIWRWLQGNQVKLVQCTGTFSYPLQRIERLAVARRTAA
jgi:DNA polymerase-3 subunit epsilon